MNYLFRRHSYAYSSRSWANQSHYSNEPGYIKSCGWEERIYMSNSQSNFAVYSKSWSKGYMESMDEKAS